MRISGNMAQKLFDPIDHPGTTAFPTSALLFEACRLLESGSPYPKGLSLPTQTYMMEIYRVSQTTPWDSLVYN